MANGRWCAQYRPAEDSRRTTCSGLPKIRTRRTIWRRRIPRWSKSWWPRSKSGRRCIRAMECALRPITRPGGKLRRNMRRRLGGKVNTMLRKYSLLFLSLAAVLAAQQPRRPAMPDNVIYEPDLDYAPAVGGKLAMDIVRPRDSSVASRPTVLCIHGGGFRAGNR